MYSFLYSCFFFKQKTAYEMRISDWSSDVCSSDLNRKWGDAIKVVRPTFADEKSRGTHVNISGASVAKHAPNKENAVKLLEYLVSDKAQSLYANANYEIGRASCRERVFQYV